MFHRYRSLLALFVPLLGIFCLNLATPVALRAADAAPTLTAPADASMQCDARKVTLKWDAAANADHYEVWLNITRTDYDFTKPGKLLDVYTKVGEVKTTTFTTDELPDRWTYQWYVKAVAKDGTATQSAVRTFSVYLPTVATGDGVTIIDGCRDLNKNGKVDDYENWKLAPAVRIKDLLSQMTPEEKAFQMYFNGKAYPLAGFMMGPCDTVDLDNMLHKNATQRLGIPLICAGDTIIGYKTTYPIQTGLAATRDWNLCYQLGNMQREEMLVCGTRSLLGPLAEVGTKVLYPRVQEGNGENAENAAAEVKAIVCGLQGGPELNPTSVMAMMKHWPGEGAGGEGGITYDAVTIKYHMKPWVAGFEAGAGSIMPGYAGASYLSPEGGGAGDSPKIIAYARNTPLPTPIADVANPLPDVRYPTTTILPGIPPTGGLGYNGIICTDWLPNGAWINAAKAGSDVMGGANPGDTSMAGFIAAVPPARLDDAVTRILNAKFRMGVFENPYGNLKTYLSVWHSPDKAELAVQAAREIMTLLKNDGALPLRLKKDDGIIVAGPDANDGNPQVVWTSYFHTEFGAKTIIQSITDRAKEAGVTVYKDSSVTVPTGGVAGSWPDGATCANPKAAIVVVGERSYTHGTFWPKEQDFLPPAQVALIEKFADKGIPTIVILHLPRPYVITDWKDTPNAIVADYRSGDGGGPAVAQLLFGDYEPHGRLPWQLPRSMDQLGTDTPNDQKERWDIPYDLGATDAERAEIRRLIDAGKTVPTNYGNPLFPYGFGIQGFGLVAGKPPKAFSLLTPADKGAVKNTPLVLTWNVSEDPDAGIRNYKVTMDDKPLATVKSTTLDLTGQKMTNGTHTWFVEAENWAGVSTKSATWSFKFQDDTQPVAFKLALPEDNVTVKGGDVTLSWESTRDTVAGLAGYDVMVDGAKVATVAAGASISSGANLALRKSATASSGAGQSATDGDATTRWESDRTDPQSLTIDLGKPSWITGVTIKWEAAYARAYTLETSDDAKTWSEVYSTGACQGGADTPTIAPGSGRYIRLTGTARATWYGYSIFEFEVYGNPTEQYTVTGLKPGAHTWSVVATSGSGNNRSSTNTGHFTVE
jgi:beta-glucosidase